MAVYVSVECRAEQDRLRYHSADTTWLTCMPMGEGDDVALICVGCWHCSPEPGVYFVRVAERSAEA